jgi:hypothetical protein
MYIHHLNLTFFRRKCSFMKTLFTKFSCYWSFLCCWFADFLPFVIDGLIWIHLDRSGTIWIDLDPSGSIWIHLDPSGSIRTFRNIKVLKFLIANRTGLDRDQGLSWSRSGPVLIAIRTGPDGDQDLRGGPSIRTLDWSGPWIDQDPGSIRILDRSGLWNIKILRVLINPDRSRLIAIRRRTLHKNWNAWILMRTGTLICVCL